MSDIRILHIISSLRRGGRERQLATIFRYSKESALESRILAFNKVESDYTEEYGLTERDVYYLGSKDTLKRISGIRKVLKEFKPDLAYVWGSFEYNFCFLLAPFTGTKFINGSIRHGIVLFNQKQVTRLIMLHLSKYIIANSRAGLRANKLRRGYVLYNGIDKKFSAPCTEEEKKQIIHSVFEDYKGETMIISVANLVPYKDYFTTLKALRNIKDMGFTFKYMAIGEGPMRESLEAEVKNLGLQEDVRFAGRKNNVEDFLRSGDLYIHSSKGEGCSNAILEAMAASLPIIASDTGGTAEITGSKNGCLFEYRNVDQLTSAIAELLADKKGLGAKGRVSRSIIEERFTVEKMVSNYLSIMQEILNKKPVKAQLG